MISPEWFGKVDRRDSPLVLPPRAVTVWLLMFTHRWETRWQNGQGCYITFHGLQWGPLAHGRAVGMANL